VDERWRLWLLGCQRRQQLRTTSHNSQARASLAKGWGAVQNELPRSLKQNDARAGPCTQR
jgi:hypothetical protein